MLTILLVMSVAAAVLAVAVVMLAPSLERPCDRCDRDEQLTCRKACQEFQQWREEGEWL